LFPPAAIDRGLFSAVLFGFLPIAYWATLAYLDRQAMPGLLLEGVRHRFCIPDKMNKISWLSAMC
jgi:hypothetical protein